MIRIKKKETKAPESANNGTNPYLNARQEWMERYGSYISRAAQWRMVAFLALIIAVLSLSGNIVQMTQTKIVRYFVVVDELGKTVAEKIQGHGGGTPEKVVQSAVAQAIVDWRTVTVDTELQKRMINNLTMHTAGATRGVLKQWYEKNSPYEVAKSGRLVHVEIKGLPLPVTKGSYRVEWNEIVRNLQGIELGRENYEAIATVEIVPPASEEIMISNPGGVYITNLSTAKVIR
ncbi:MAG: type IV secretion system protein [Desulfobulbaceae bacterium]|nr:type IV secretion system protein [Desulfobulbaceae bacterium]